jgi:adenylate cyclase
MSAPGPQSDVRNRPDVAALAAWLVSEGCRRMSADELLAALGEQLIAAGVPLRRVAVGVQAIHPEVSSVTMSWERGCAARQVEWFHGIESSPMYRGSPIEAIHLGAARIRCKLEGATDPKPFKVFEELAAAGITDYLALGPIDSMGRPLVLVLDTDAPGGFSEAHVALIEELVPLASLRIELLSSQLQTHSLLKVYLGRQQAQRVQSGAVRRGTGERIQTVLMATDLRGFTALADRMDPEAVVALLDRYFEAVCDPVVAAGGDVLKFIGDAVLAVFPIDDDAGELTRGAVCRRALGAAQEAVASLEALRREAPLPGAAGLRMGVALHLGIALYGNIGARRRLDFTVIGASVNEVCRLEPLTKRLRVPIVVSSRFAASCAGAEFSSLGSHRLRGVSEEVEVFAPVAAGAER